MQNAARQAWTEQRARQGPSHNFIREPLQINLFGDFVEYSGDRPLCSKNFGNTQIHVFKVATDLKNQDLARNP